MLRFKVFENGAPAKSVDLEDAYLVGNDRVPQRTRLEFVNGEITCATESSAAAALSIMWPVEGVGRIMLETTRLMERPRPYNLHVELARGQLMRISQKREDWGLYDYPDDQGLYQEIQAARDLLTDALTARDDVAAARQGDAAIAASVKVGEAMGVFHSAVFLERQRAAGKLSKRPLGCRFEVTRNSETYVKSLAEAFDFVSLPFTWRTMEPQEGVRQTRETELIEKWLRVFRQQKVHVRGGSLLSFEPAHLPQWLGVLSEDYERLREAMARHLKRTFKQFGAHVHSWEVISGVHAYNVFRLSLEQIMELTRMAAILAKQRAPKSTAIIGIALPWGEYYSRDPRTIAPVLYAQMVAQHGINFDAFGLEMTFGGNEPGHYVRDMMQISAMLDQFCILGKQVHVTAAGVPSSGKPTRTGCWHGQWTEEVQAQWVREFYQIAFSKGFVETVTWQTLADPPDGSHACGLLRADLSPKPAFEEILALRAKLRPSQTDSTTLEAS
ncbi:MAG: endo-1,4-beta-xylanase [Phycisphaerae bacterium]|nr:endo-1,4-beta-xylanase [Phycisphaerae bacterium]